MRRWLPVLALAVITTMPLSGCATTLGGLFHRKPEVGVIVAEPESGVRITLTNLKTGEKKSWERNDVRIALDKAYDYRLTVSAEGYQDEDFTITRSTSALLYGNAACVAVGTCVGCVSLVGWIVTIPVGCLLSGIGFGIDFLTGSANTFNQPDIHVTLKKAQNSGLEIELRNGHGHVLATRSATPAAR